MKKIFTLVLTLLIGQSWLMAQTSGGPDAWGYVWRDSNDTLTANAPVYNWIDIVGLPNATQVKNLNDDDMKGPFPIGFDFHYYWYNRSNFYIGSNGFITFNNAGVAAPFPVIPSTSLSNNPQDYIAAMASDLTFVTGSGSPVPGADCWYYTTPGNDSLIVSWISVPFWDNLATGNYTGENSFQVIISSVDSSITVQFKKQLGVYVNVTGFLTVGIENVSGTLGLQHSHDVYPDTNYTVKFYYPANPTFQVNDAATNYNDNAGTGGLFIPLNGAPFVMKTEVVNAGNQVLNPFNVTSQILNPGGSVILSNTALSDTLQPGQTQLITHLNPFNPTLPGVHQFITSTQLINDIVSTNNQQIMELRVVDTTVNSLSLQFEDGAVSTVNTLSWQGGNGGAGYYFIPPFYPCIIDTIQSYIVSNISTANFYMEIYDDDGPFGVPGTRLDSQLVINPTPPAGGAWFGVALPNPITINSGGFYLSWNMDGENVTLGINDEIPLSNRTYEVLGSSWSVFRFRESQELMIRANISKPSGVGITNTAKNEIAFGNFYPNPAKENTTMQFTMADGVKNISYSLYDMQGSMIEKSVVQAESNRHNQVVINTRNLKPGVYNCNFVIDGKLLNRRFIVNH